MSAPASDADAFRAFEAEGWERTTDPYDRFFGPITDRIADHASSMSVPDPVTSRVGRRRGVPT